MPLYEDSKYHPLFIGDMHPVKLMDGNKVVFEPNVSELSGEGLSVNKTYNDSAFVRINGNTQEIGEGDKSPDNPYELKSVNNFDLVSSGKNLFDVINSNMSMDTSTGSYSKIGSVITAQGNNSTAGQYAASRGWLFLAGNITSLYQIPVFAGKTYTFSMDVKLLEQGNSTANIRIDYAETGQSVAAGTEKPLVLGQTIRIEQSFTAVNSTLSKLRVDS